MEHLWSKDGAQLADVEQLWSNCGAKMSPVRKSSAHALIYGALKKTGSGTAAAESAEGVRLLRLLTPQTLFRAALRRGLSSRLQ